MFKKTQYKFKSYKSDAAPFFFYIEIFPFNSSLFEFPYLKSLIETIAKNPIVPIPMRVDRVNNGISSVMIRPREDISFKISGDKIAVINPYQFLSSGIKNLVYFSEIRSSERFIKSISKEKVISWWEGSRFLYGNLFRLEEDFTAFLKAYLLTMVKSYIEEDDIVSAAIQYCQIIEDVCKKRMNHNKILTEIDGEQSIVKMYKKKDATYYKKFKKVSELHYHPELIDIEIFDYYGEGWPKEFTSKKSSERKVLKYIPLLFYDDLQECMLLNLKDLEKNEKAILNPSILVENQIINLINPEDYNENFKNKNIWWKDFNTIKPEMHVDEMLRSRHKLKVG